MVRQEARWLLLVHKVSGMRGTLHWLGMPDGYVQWDLRWCGLAIQEILAKIADAQCGNSGGGVR
jgi:hypothetical protein